MGLTYKDLKRVFGSRHINISERHLKILLSVVSVTLCSASLGAPFLHRQRRAQDDFRSEAMLQQCLDISMNSSCFVHPKAPMF